jgi:DNA primase
MLSSSGRNKINTDDRYTEGQVREVLAQCGITLGSELDTHFLIFCPFHNNRNTPACEVDKEKGLFICFSCGENGTLMDIIMKTTKRSYFEASRLINNAAKETDFAKQIFNTTNKSTDKFEEFDSVLIARLHSDCLSSERSLHYWSGRGISPESIDTFHLGYSENQDMVIVPVQTDTGMFVGFVARSIEGKSFKNSTNLPRSKVLFNLNRCKFTEIIVVESSFDAIKLHQMGFNAVATLGANVSREQLRLLEKYATKIILAPDSDEAGQSFVNKIMDNIKSREISLIKIPAGKKDIGDMTKEEILSAMDNKTLDLLFQL